MRSPPPDRSSPKRRRRDLSWERRSFEEIQTVADLKQPDRPEADRRQQDDALEQGLPQRLEIEDEQEIADRAKHQGAENRADRAARSAKQRHAAQYDGGDRV